MVHSFTDMKLTEAQRMAKSLLAQYHVEDYKFNFDESVSRFGYCNFTDKIISISKHLTELNDEAIIKNTLLHEIAHALTEGCGHNEVWQRVCIAIGGDGQRCYSDEIVDRPTRKYTATCPKCGKSIQRNRRNPRLHCSDCYKITHRFSKEIKFRWTKN